MNYERAAEAMEAALKSTASISSVDVYVNVRIIVPPFSWSHGDHVNRQASVFGSGGGVQESKQVVQSLLGDFAGFPDRLCATVGRARSRGPLQTL